MRIFHFRPRTTTILNIVTWPVLHMIIAFTALLLPWHLFSEKQWLFRTRSWEREGSLYQKLFKIARWKNRLPDGAQLFAGSFSKKRATSTNPAYLDRFVKETCRAELAHLIGVGIAPVFFLWNPWYAGIIHMVYALSANAPFIIVQRYNRPQLLRILKRKTMVRKASPARAGKKDG